MSRWPDLLLTVVEGIYGTFRYHLRIAGKHDALCGNGKVMPCEVPIESWGVRTHLRERYCSVCENRADTAQAAQKAKEGQ